VPTKEQQDNQHALDNVSRIVLGLPMIAIGVLCIVAVAGAVLKPLGISVATYFAVALAICVTYPWVGVGVLIALFIGLSAWGYESWMRGIIRDELNRKK
jgi:hypothetical protein